MDGIPETVPDEQAARLIAHAWNFTPYPMQFYDQFIYASGKQVFTFAIGDKTVNIQFLTDGPLIG